MEGQLRAAPMAVVKTATTTSAYGVGFIAWRLDPVPMGRGGAHGGGGAPLGAVGGEVGSNDCGC